MADVQFDFNAVVTSPTSPIVTVYLKFTGSPTFCSVRVNGTGGEDPSLRERTKEQQSAAGAFAANVVPLVFEKNGGTPPGGYRAILYDDGGSYVGNATG